MFPTPKQVVYDVPVDRRKYDVNGFIRNINNFADKMEGVIFREDSSETIVICEVTCFHKSGLSECCSDIRRALRDSKW